MLVSVGGGVMRAGERGRRKDEMRGRKERRGRK